MVINASKFGRVGRPDCVPLSRRARHDPRRQFCMMSATISARMRCRHRQDGMEQRRAMMSAAWSPFLIASPPYPPGGRTASYMCC